MLHKFKISSAVILPHRPREEPSNPPQCGHLDPWAPSWCVTNLTPAKCMRSWLQPDKALSIRSNNQTISPYKSQCWTSRTAWTRAHYWILKIARQMKVTAINYFRTEEGTLGLMMTQSFILLYYESLNHDFLKRKLNPVVSLQSASWRRPVYLSITSS